MRPLDQAAQMRVPLCLLLLVAHVVDTLPLNRRKKQGKRSSPTGVGAQRSSEEGQTGHGRCWAMDSTGQMPSGSADRPQDTRSPSWNQETLQGGIEQLNPSILRSPNFPGFAVSCSEQAESSGARVGS